jgi:hypothetical protein
MFALRRQWAVGPESVRRVMSHSHASPRRAVGTNHRRKIKQNTQNQAKRPLEEWGRFRGKIERRGSVSKPGFLPATDPPVPIKRHADPNKRRKPWQLSRLGFVL